MKRSTETKAKKATMSVIDLIEPALGEVVIVSYDGTKLQLNAACFLGFK